MSGDLFDDWLTTEPADDPFRCEIHGTYGQCIECLNTELDRQHDTRKEQEP